MKRYSDVLPQVLLTLMPFFLSAAAVPLSVRECVCVNTGTGNPGNLGNPLLTEANITLCPILRTFLQYTERNSNNYLSAAGQQ